MIQLRIVRETFEVCVKETKTEPLHEENFVCSTIIREFAYDDDPYAITAEELGMSDELYPSRDDADGAVRNGDHIYRYKLVTCMNKFIKTLHPYATKPADPFAAWLPDDIFSLSHDDDN